MSPTPASSPSRRRLRQTALLGAGLLVASIIGTAVSSATPATPSTSDAWGQGTLTNSELLSLVGQMTLPEEIGIVHGTSDTDCGTTIPLGCVGEAGIVPGVARLGIPPLRMTDGPAGIRLSHVETAMPAPVGLAASFDPAAAKQFGQTVGQAGRATGQDVWLGPMVNEVNYPTAGRNFETLGEDPYLAGQLAAQEVTGAQSEGLVTELKHFIENDFENGRSSTNVVLDDQTLHETELLTFQAAINAGAGSVMCSYNRVNYVYGCGNSTTINDVLRQQLAFTGFVQSDWGAVHKATDLVDGDNIEEPSGANFTTATLTNAVRNGTPAVAATADYPAFPAITGQQWKQALDTAAYHILGTMNQADLLEGTQYGSHFTGTPTPWVPGRPDLAGLQAGAASAAQSIAEDSATLLKNDDSVLPLAKADTKKGGLVVMGPTATAAYYGGGGSAHVTPYDGSASPLSAIQTAAGAGNPVSYVPGYDLDGQVVPSSALSAPDPAAGYPNWTLTSADQGFAGKPGLLRQQVTTAAVPSGAQPVLDLDPGAAPDQLDPTVNRTGASAIPAGTAFRWTGLLTAPANPGGTGWQLKVFVNNQTGSQLFVDGLATAQRTVNIGAYPQAPASSYASLAEANRSHDPATATLQQAGYSVNLTAGQQIHLDLRVTAGDSPAQIQLRWVPPDNQTTAINQAVAAAKTAKKVVLFAYDDGQEGSDRGGSNQAAGLELPGYQDALISAVAAANPNTVVVLNTGDAVLMPWASAVKGILEMWYPGQQGGAATANVLFGKTDPGGRLPITFPAGATQQPMYDPNCTDTSTTGNCPIYPGTVGPSPFLAGATTSYRTITGMQVNGIYEGYRWYDEKGVQPLFPFGFGMSYTSFDYSKLSESGNRSAAGIDVTFTVTNTGTVKGSETPQVYLGPSPDLPAGVQQAVRKLVGFQRVTLAPGGSQTITLHVTQQQLSSWSDAANSWLAGTGARTVYVGSSSRDPRLQKGFTLKN
ncbi:MAG TPA: glycoside hydrolase family 3 C-terminal domain-containing protein [Pseudonocardiaceae bacterium]|jgi:beta-glucosidase|nr:glycoside hydrolase family 3 C-terminal domain-containing protein [Pseudonocardiaceae bacterium]